jgi:hypothetical protein
MRIPLEEGRGYAAGKFQTWKAEPLNASAMLLAGFPQVGYLQESRK